LNQNRPGVPEWICETCGVQYPASAEPPAGCPICEDERQYVPEEGQRWTTLDELRAGHRAEIREEEPGLLGLGCEPSFAIGQRALLVEGVLWDCITLLDDGLVAAVEARGGLRAIAISHPHYYSAMVEWAHRFECPIHLHADDAEWIMRPDPSVELWEGETKELEPGLPLIRCGGHFAGGTVLHWAGGSDGAGTLLSGDIVQVIPDRRHVSFMWSYPNLVPLPAEAIERIAAALEPFAFEQIQGAWWGTIVRRDGSDVVRRSAERYVRALRGELPGA
jgi:hypothetical protein